MNASFSFRRLGLLIRKQGLEQGRFYMLASIAMFGIILLSFIFFWILMDRPHYSEDVTYVMYYCGLFIGGAFFASMAFAPLGEKEKGMYWLGFPASHAEKLATTIFFTTIMFFLVYTAQFFIVKWLAVGFLEKYIVDGSAITYRELRWTDEWEQLMGYLLLCYFAVQSLFLLGSVYFRKYAFIKTIITGVVFWAVYVFVIYKAFRLIIPENYNWELLEMRSMADERTGMYEYYTVGQWVRSSLLFALKWIWVPLFWLVSWFSLKEKEI